MSLTHIEVRGARTHNLKNIDVRIPRDKLVVITGLSGSGKSSLAFDTIYAEGQRRYVESLSAYARQFLSMMDKPDFDHIEGLSPAISIDQKSTSHNPRSTVGTITEIHDYLRLLFARIGTPHCPTHHIALNAQTVQQMTTRLLELPEEGTAFMILAPVVRDRKGEYQQLLQELVAQGFLRVRIDGEVVMLDGEVPTLDKKRKHTIEVVVDRIRLKQTDTAKHDKGDNEDNDGSNDETSNSIAERITESLETALRLGNDVVHIQGLKDDEDLHMVLSATRACPECGFSIAELEPRLFSFNSPEGACPECDGLGTLEYLDITKLVNPELTLAEGAIEGWGKLSGYYFSMVEAVATHYGASVHAPYKSLPKEVQDALLHGTKEAIRLPGMYRRKRKFDGVVAYIERRYRETDNRMVREQLSAYMKTDTCPSCEGQRLNPAARAVRIEGYNIADLSAMSIEECYKFFENFKPEGGKGQIAEKILKEILARLSFLVNVGLNYLTLARTSSTLSGGEAQRIRLASQIGAGLVGVMYILDEPSIGLHQRDNDRLLKTLIHLRDLGNTVIVVEHDEDTIRAADHIVDIGPKAGVHGGQLVANGSVQDVLNATTSITGQFLSGERAIAVPETREDASTNGFIELAGCTGNNLKNLTVQLPIGVLTCITGVSGSGKSTLINRTLLPHAAHLLNRRQQTHAAPFEAIRGLEHFDKVIDIDQSPIGRTPRSNPATYIGIFTQIRELFAMTEAARMRGYKPGRFSFNVRGGRCEACAGDGLIKVEMHFLPDVYIVCEECGGSRYNSDTLKVKYKGKSIADVLDMTVDEACEFFEALPAIARKINTLRDVGLGYIRLGQSATTLSGGEAQRIKLAKELARMDTGKTLYILDEPTTGLHFHDIDLLLNVLLKLRARGNTILVIEHNLDVVKTADWIVDLGPEGGDGGGELVVAGTPEAVAKHPTSYTGKFLQPLLRA